MGVRRITTNLDNPQLWFLLNSCRFDARTHFVYDFLDEHLIWIYIYIHAMQIHKLLDLEQQAVLQGIWQDIDEIWLFG